MSGLLETSGIPPQKATTLAHLIAEGETGGQGKEIFTQLTGADFRAGHVALHQFPIQEGWINVTQFREPMARIMSYYRMLRAGENSPAWRDSIGVNLPRSWEQFATVVPLKILMRQLFMFSNHLDVTEALANIEKIDHVLFLIPGVYEDGIRALGENLIGVPFKPIHHGPSPCPSITPKELLADEKACNIIRERAEQEFELWEALNPPEPK